MFESMQLAAIHLRSTMIMSLEKVLAWIGLCRNGSMIGPFFFDRNLHGEGYVHLINE